MRTVQDVKKLIIHVAKEDERIRGVILSGSRADVDCPADIYQDYDIAYYVKDVSPYWDNTAWIEEKFGAPILLQKPESMELIPPEGTGKYVYLMIFSDGYRIDLTITNAEYMDDGEPAIVLLDKDHMFPKIKIDPEYWWVKKPTKQFFLDCANEFHWCMNNVVKGIARDEVPYAMHMTNHVREMLIQMISWYIGSEHDFKVSVGKCGKYLKKYLSEELYKQFINTYTTADEKQMWDAVFNMVDLFGIIARKVAKKLDFIYDEEEERGIIAYMNLIKNEWNRE